METGRLKHDYVDVTRQGKKKKEVPHPWHEDVRTKSKYALPDPSTLGFFSG